MPNSIPKQATAEDWETAREFMKRAEQAFTAGDKETILDLFDDNVLVVFADFPPIHGREAYGRFLDARLARQLDYRPLTTIRTVVANVIGASWDATWTDARTKLPMRGRGCEFVTIEQGKIIEFIVCFNAWDEATGPRTPII